MVSGAAPANGVGATMHAKAKVNAMEVSFAPVPSGIRVGMDIRQLAARHFKTRRASSAALRFQKP